MKRFKTIGWIMLGIGATLGLLKYVSDYLDSHQHMIAVSWVESGNCRMVWPERSKGSERVQVIWTNTDGRDLFFECDSGKYRVPLKIQPEIAGEEVYGAEVDPVREGVRLER